MSDLLAARAQMAISLGFHIIFAAISIAMPVFMVVAELLWLRSRDKSCLELAHAWAKGTAIFFAVGAVSGTVLSFELGLLWPSFLGQAGSVVGLPFALEGFAFFTEAIFLGIYLYGWDRVGPRAHAFAGAVVAFSGVLSAIFVLCANAWMQTPAGFRLDAGKIVATDPIAAMLNPASFHEAFHMLCAVFAAVGFAVAGVHAFLLRRAPESPFHRRAVEIALGFGIAGALLLPVSGDVAARRVARFEKAKLAALEGQFATERGAPLRIGGLPDAERRTTRFAVEIPHGLSLLAFHELDAEVVGLDAFPLDEQPNPVVCHLAFQTMVGLGSWLMLVSVWALAVRFRRGGFTSSPRLLKALVATAPAGFLAIEAGWTVTECGRQPWIVAGVLKTRDAVTPVPGVWLELVAFTSLYVFLAVVVMIIVKRQMTASVPHA
jgi:cytochrome d ubiquinol oxidase subunit I